MPKKYQNLRNREELTPHEVFVRDHKILREQGEKWLKETSTSCLLVLALIKTVIFATVFTVPGETNEDTGAQKLDKDFHLLFSSCRRELVFLPSSCPSQRPYTARLISKPTFPWSWYVIWLLSTYASFPC